MKKICLLIVTVVLAALLCSGCTLIDRIFGNNDDGIIQDKNVLEDQKYLVETVYVGVVLPQTQGDPDRLKHITDAQQLACDMLNKQHSIGWDLGANAGITGYGAARMELIYADSTSPEALQKRYPARYTASSLIEQGVVALLGAGNSATTAEVALRARQNSLPLISGSIGVNEAAENNSYDFGGWFCSTALTPTMESDLFFSYLKNLNQTQAAGITKVAILYEDTEDNADILAAFDAAAAAYNFEVAARISYNTQADNINQDLQRLMLSGAQVVFHSGSTEQLCHIAQVYREAGFVPNAALVYNGGFAAAELTAQLKDLGVNYWGGCSVIPLDTQDAQSQSESVRTYSYINRIYREKNGSSMDNSALCEFAAVTVLAQAIGSAGTTDPAAVNTVLRGSSFDAPYLAAGKISFDSQGSLSSGCGVLALVIDGTPYEVYRK